MQLFKQHMLFHHCFPHQEHFRQKLLFERHIEHTKLYSKRQFDRTIFAKGLKIGNVIGTNWLKHHHDYCYESYRELHELSRRSKLMSPLVQFQMQLAKEKYKKALETMEFN